MKRRRGHILIIALSLGVVAGACAAPRAREVEEAPVTRYRDPALDELERLIDRVEQGPADGDVSACLARLDALGSCPEDTAAAPRTVNVRVGLDPRYLEWPEPWDRLARTLACVNRFYEPTGVQWDFVAIDAWDPGPQRHALYPLLERLQRDFPFDGQTLRLGITVWEERRVFSHGGGEIGLSQRDACVVPSWPRIENDCLILAHELGHLIGAIHVPGKQWIMGWAASPFHLPAADPLERVAAAYRFHPRNVAAIRAHRTARFTPAGLRPTPDCAQRIAEVDRCYAL